MKNLEKSHESSACTPAGLRETGEHYGLSTADVSTLLRTVGDNARNVLGAAEEAEASRRETPPVRGTATSWEV